MPRRYSISQHYSNIFSQQVQADVVFGIACVLQLKKLESVHTNGQTKAKPTSQLLEPRNDKVSQVNLTSGNIVPASAIVWCSLVQHTFG